MSLTHLIHPVIHYQFGCNDKGEAQVIDSGPLMDTLLAHHQNAPLCSLSTNGILSASSLKSTSTIEELQQVAKNAEGFAMEVWVHLLEDSAISRPILSFADPTYNGMIDEDCSGVHVALAQRGSQLEFRYVDYLAPQYTCRVLVVPESDSTPRRMKQVVAVWLQGKTNIYLDGVRIIQGAPNQFDTTLSLWNPLSTLQLFGQGLGVSLNMFSIYNQTLTDADVTELHRKGELLLANTPRKPLAITILRSPPVHIFPQGTSTSMTVIIDFEIASGSVMVQDDWFILVEFQSMPLFGKLFHYNQGQEEEERFHLNQQIPLDNLASILYQPDSVNFFNAPLFTFNGTSLNSQREFFSYRFLAVSLGEPKSQILASSETIEQELIAVHVNHVPLLRTPTHAVISEDQPTGLGARPCLYLEGIQLLDDLDFNIDRVRVDLWAYNGTLSISNLDRADFSSCRSSERQALLGSTNWGCFGDGVANRNLTFVATPDDVTWILSRVNYSGFYWGQEDQVVIRIYDGVDGSCLSQKEHRLVPYHDGHYHTIHNNDCFEVIATISIPAVAVQDFKGNYVKEFLDVGDFGIADAVFWGFLLVFMVFCCVSIRTCIRCVGARGSKIHVDEASHDSHSFV